MSYTHNRCKKTIIVGLNLFDPTFGPKNNKFLFYKDAKYTKNFTRTNLKHFHIYKNKNHILSYKLSTSLSINFFVMGENFNLTILRHFTQSIKLDYLVLIN